MSNSSKLNGLHMVVAVTQDSVNYQFSLLHGQNIIHKKLDIVVDDDIVELHADVSSPTIIFGLKGDPRSVLFIVRMPKGKFTYWKGVGPKAQKTVVDFTNWSYAFHVSLDMQEIQKEKLEVGKTVPKVVKDHLDQFSTANFTIQHLFMDFQNANLADWDVDHSSMVFPDGAKINDNQLQQFQTLFSNHFKNLKGTDNPYILGYAINARPAGAPSALDPTSSTFSTVKDSSKPGNSTLNFLLMTGHQALPANPGLFKDNWVIPADVDGSMIIAHTLFWEGWVLPSLRLGDGTKITVREAGGWSMDLADKREEKNTANDGTPYTETYYDTRSTQVTFTSEPKKLRLALAGSWEKVDRTDVWAYGSWSYFEAHGRVQWSATATLSPGANGQLGLVKDPSPPFSPESWTKSGGVASRDVNEKALARHWGELVNQAVNGMQVSGLNQRLVLPAGGVFFFRGIRVDEAGDVHLDVSFKT